jgi:hypothetical protein
MYAAYGAAGWGMDGSETWRKTQGEHESTSTWTLMGSRYVLWTARIDTTTLSSHILKKLLPSTPGRTVYGYRRKKYVP